ncbi:MAG: signal peptidase I, partial [Micrococcaceae bacterium]|nr:signal peptidase I [Micrococcaceae bacterium]
VPYVGFVANWLGNQNRGLFSEVAAGGFILYGAALMVNGVRSRLKRNKANVGSTSMELAA